MYIRAKIFTHSKKEKVLQKSKHTFEIHTKEKAEQNKANIRVREMLAEHLNISTKKISLVSGHQRPQKMFLVRDEL